GREGRDESFSSAARDSHLPRPARRRDAADQDGIERAERLQRNPGARGELPEIRRGGDGHPIDIRHHGLARLEPVLAGITPDHHRGLDGRYEVLGLAAQVFGLPEVPEVCRAGRPYRLVDFDLTVVVCRLSELPGPVPKVENAEVSC